MLKSKNKAKTEIATFGAGCFWHIEEAFRTLKGVLNTEVGYEGGKMQDPSYEDVSTHRTGHVEVLQLEFDPKIVSYEKLLEVFWKIHDPTTLDRQGLDIGNQYKSIIFYHTEEQKKKAEKSKKDLEKKGIFGDPIVTEIVKAGKFWKAEDYHQKYLMKRGLKSCAI
ncbi:peptide-methionine (S)-S-oxide reductase MsrA [Candidatus Pacearchaeota archaeon]|nr:peptide-methionine (S)-S-oxide reductase MsrA [Candidatus Pacearchaeota archaeon]